MAARDTFSVLIWNTGGHLRLTNAHPDAILKQIEAYDADIVLLQEMAYPQVHERLARRYGHTAKQRTLANPVYSKRKIVETGIVSLDPSGIKGAQPASYITLGDKKSRVRIYNCHLPIKGIGIEQRQRCADVVFLHAKRSGLRCIIAGDMNTTLPKKGMGRRLTRMVHNIPYSGTCVHGVERKDDERVTFARNANRWGFHDALDLWTPTWCLPRTRWEFLGLKLDWFFTKGISAKLRERGPYITDHRPLLLDCDLD